MIHVAAASDPRLTAHSPFRNVGIGRVQPHASLLRFETEFPGMERECGRGGEINGRLVLIYPR